MRKHSIIIIAISLTFCLNSFHIKAQNSAFEKGTVVATTGYGFPDLYRGTLRLAYNNYIITSIKSFGPILVKGDYGIKRFKWGHIIGAGIVLGYGSREVAYLKWGPYKGLYPYNQKNNYKTITIGARGTYHFYTKEKFDCYASVGLGFNINSSIQTTNDPNGADRSAVSRSGVYSALTVGIRYFFTKSIGVYSELGWDMSAPIQAGIALKF